ncbi:hypothetical protein [Hymenobacter glaciei]|uniref:hypothetical protein n=1 Tax=Hymenobacter glaciei TaxID=877209 RepID=UPI0031EA3E35
MDNKSNCKMNGKRLSWLLGLLLVLGDCSCSRQPNICNCCATTYTSVGSAQNCLSETAPYKSTADERLILIAFVTKDIKANQELGWNIINDQAIIQLAKRKYLLVTLDVNGFQSPPELLGLIKKHKNRPFFVIVNQALYPFAEWTTVENKDFIISRLVNGNGP